MNNSGPFPEWTEAISVGVDCLDEDHQAFFRLSALLREILSSPGEHQEPLIDTALNILEEYIEGHFLREQIAMAEVEYPLLADHVAAHDAFAARVGRIAGDYRECGERSGLVTLCGLVTSWIYDHIRTMDARYHGILTCANVDDRPLAFLAAAIDADLEF